MLSGKRLLKLAKQAHEEHPEAFEALLEYERTGKLPKLNPKKSLPSVAVKKGDKPP